MKKAIFALLVLSVLLGPLTTYAYDPRYLFTDQEKDTESGLYNFDAREYNPEIGRFIQPDPVLNNLPNPQALKQQTGQDLQDFLKDPQSLNSYGYARNNPIRYVDPMGEFNFETNEVEKGDSLYKVFGNYWKEVANYNSLENPNLIYPGQHLALPEFVKKNFWQNIADIATAVLPGLSDARDIIESLTKDDLITGRALTIGEESITIPSVLIIGIMSGKEMRGLNRLDKWLKSKVGEPSDWIRFGSTYVPPEALGKDKPIITWGIKGGGVNDKTGFKLPFHFHVHKYNWYKPWSWFKNY